MASAAGKRTIKNDNLTKTHEIICSNGFILLKNDYREISYESTSTGKHIHINITKMDDGDVIALAVPLSDDNSYYKTTIDSGYEDLEKYIKNFLEQSKISKISRRCSDIDTDIPVVDADVDEDVDKDDDADEDVDDDDDDDDVEVLSDSSDDYEVIDPLDMYKLHFRNKCIQNWHSFFITAYFINILAMMEVRWRAFIAFGYFVLYSQTTKALFRPTCYLVITYSCTYIVGDLTYMAFLSKMLKLWIINVIMHLCVIREFPKFMGDITSSIIWSPYIASMVMMPKKGYFLKNSLGAPYNLEDMMSKEELINLLKDIDNDDSD